MKLTRFYVSAANLDDKNKSPLFIVACEKHHDEVEMKLGTLFMGHVSHWEAEAEPGDVCKYADRGDCGDIE